MLERLLWWPRRGLRRRRQLRRIGRDVWLVEVAADDARADRRSIVGATAAFDEDGHRDLRILGGGEAREPAMCRQVALVIRRPLIFGGARLTRDAQPRNLEPLQ